MGGLYNARFVCYFLLKEYKRCEKAVDELSKINKKTNKEDKNIIENYKKLIVLLKFIIKCSDYEKEHNKEIKNEDTEGLEQMKETATKGIFNLLKIKGFEDLEKKYENAYNDLKSNNEKLIIENNTLKTQLKNK